MVWARSAAAGPGPGPGPRPGPGRLQPSVDWSCKEEWANIPARWCETDEVIQKSVTSSYCCKYDYTSWWTVGCSWTLIGLHEAFHNSTYCITMKLVRCLLHICCNHCIVLVLCPSEWSGSLGRVGELGVAPQCSIWQREKVNCVYMLRYQVPHKTELTGTHLMQVGARSGVSRAHRQRSVKTTGCVCAQLTCKWSIRSFISEADGLQG